ncbi:MAG: hypothetical protein GXP31_01355 [Kiritimatiellaeota bacterium]|nr:hypothetical protein [Kiritimatiellota bacterium]
MRRTLAAIAVGLIGSLFIWWAVPYNNFVLGNSYISDDYIPTAALFVVFVLVLGVNPLLHRFRPGVSLTSGQLAVVFGILLVACVTPSQGLLREFSYMLAGACKRVSQDQHLADLYRKLGLPPALFPDRLGYMQDTPVSDSLLQQLRPGERVPWGAWIRPTLAWGGFLLPWWLMMTAVAVIVLPQWRDNERLAFPLLTVQQSLIESPGPGHCFAPIFRTRSFWIGAGMVFVLHLLSGLHQYNPGAVPAVPLTWNLSNCFAEAPLTYLPWYVKDYRLHFIFLGVAFFMPKRIGFSIWFFQIVYALVILFGTAYRPPFHYQMITDHRIGAFFAVPLWILWLGRARWAQVLRRTAVPGNSDEERRDRAAGLALLAGFGGMLAWMLWVRVSPLWALALLILSFFYALAITRIVAETGLPLIAPDTRYTLTLARLVPASWRTAASMYFAGIVGFFIGHGNRLCVTTMVIHALGLDKRSGAKRQLRLAGLFLGVIVLSVVVCGGVHLWASYHHAATLDGRESPISRWGVGTLRWNSEPLLRDFASGARDRAGFNQPAHIAFGAALAGVIYWLCQVSPRWPLHPVALLFVGNWYAHRVWFNVFLGWLAKVLILRYGGSRLYTRSKPFFIGLILGEVFAVAFWGVVTGVLAALGRPYEVVEILPF